MAVSLRQRILDEINAGIAKARECGVIIPDDVTDVEITPVGPKGGPTGPMPMGHGPTGPQSRVCPKCGSPVGRIIIESPTKGRIVCMDCGAAF